MPHNIREPLARIESLNGTARSASESEEKKLGALTRRPYHAFLSYAHEDGDVARRLYRWLIDAGFEVWFDEHNLQIGAPVAARLAEQMWECQHWIVLTSKKALASTWVTAEREQALDTATKSPGFKIINIRIDDCEIPPALSRFIWIDATGGMLTFFAALGIINLLDGRLWTARQRSVRDVYISRGWRPGDAPFSDPICQCLASPQFGLRLIGDAIDQKTFSPERVQNIIASCRGHIAVLPARSTGSTPTENDYKYFLRELALSRELGLPQLLISQPGTPLPPSLDSSAYRYDFAGPAEITDRWQSSVPDFFAEFLEDLHEPPRLQRLFLAAEFRDDAQQAKQLRDFIEALTGLPCLIGNDLEGQGLHGQIADTIAAASVFLANLGGIDSPSGAEPHINLNTCVEAGIAMGASATRLARGEAAIPIFLLVYCVGQKGRTQRLPFMFRDSQISWYAGDPELLANCRRLLLPYRRRILNFAFAQPD